MVGISSSTVVYVANFLTEFQLLGDRGVESYNCPVCLNELHVAVLILHSGNICQVNVSGSAMYCGILPELPSTSLWHAPGTNV